MSIMKYAFVLWIVFCLMACSTQPQPMVEIPVSYLALGDSYTIGESVSEEGRWPNQLVATLQEKGLKVSPPKIIATTGWTTSELMDGINSSDIDAHYDLVSLSIGVNDQYRGYSISEFESRFEALILRAISLAKDRPQRVFVLSIPDYSITQFAASLDTLRVAKEIEAYNALKRKVCKKYNIQFFDITPISRLAKDDISLIAEDQLHPSAAMYQQWIELIAKDVAELIQ